jgi:short-subunit dehydrogenase
MSARLPFQTALVTGASSGIGRALALRLGHGGVAVALVARRLAELQEAARAIEASGGRALVLGADLALPEEAMRVAREAEASLGRIDLLVLNAGIGRNAPLEALAWEEIEATVRVNLLGAMALVRALLPGMLERRSGTIAGISSIASYRGLPGSAHYSASKAALSTFLESVRVESRPSGVAVVDIHPGYVDTPMTRNRTRRPFVMDAESAVDRILDAIVRKKRVYDFPWQMALLLRVLRLLPAALFDRLLAGRHLKSR